MVDKGPLLTSAIIFYLSIGAAIFQVIEEPSWEIALSNYKVEKEKILKQYPCLTKAGLDQILKVSLPLFEWLNVQNYLLQLVFTLECNPFVLIVLVVALCVKAVMHEWRKKSKVYTYGFGAPALLTY